MLDTKPQIQEAQTNPTRTNTNNKNNYNNNNNNNNIHIVISYSNYRKLKITKKYWQKPADENTLKEKHR